VSAPHPLPPLPGRNTNDSTFSPSEAHAWARELGLQLRYDCDLEQLAPQLRDRFTQFGIDQSLLEYFVRARRERHGRLLTWVHRSLRGLLSDFDINGLLGTYPMHVLGPAQWEHLLPDASGRLLDVGAGNGDVTRTLAPLFDDVTVVETSRYMARRLRRQGYRCHSVDLGTATVPEGPYDVISLLNVLDRCDRPLSLLGNLRAALKPGGRLVVALVLPYRPFVYDGATSRPPTERIELPQGSWEQAASELADRVLGPLGLEVEHITRAPYLSGGDAYHPLYELDDVVMVCRATGGLLLLG
jgi:SAM-dependent methyltransferase